MNVSDEELAQYFEKYGWRFEQRRHDLLRTGFFGQSGSFEVWVRLTEHWVFFIINPYVTRTESQVFDADMLRLILESNQRINLAKFGLDDEGDVVLSVDMPVTGFNYQRFEDALTALSHYADMFHHEFAAVAALGYPGESS
jgi:hypothetical protein